MIAEGKLDRLPIKSPLAAVSCGIYKGQPVLDLDYDEDSVAETDANFVLTGDKRIVEIQGTAEEHPFTEEEFLRLMRLARIGVDQLVKLQNEALGL